MAASPTDLLFEAAMVVRENAWVPYSRFGVGAAIRSVSGGVHVGCNVENAAYPEGTCAEAGAIAAMVAAGETEIDEILIVADSPRPVPPCGGCRQKIAEFATAQTRVVMSTTLGERRVVSVAELLPGSFSPADMARAGRD